MPVWQTKKGGIFQIGVNMRNCCVTGCISGSAADLRKTHAAGERSKSLFYVPKCPVRLKKWQEAFQRENQTLNPKSAVCELHFREDDVIKFDETVLKDGKTHRIPRLRYKLSDEAVPTIGIDRDGEQDTSAQRIPDNNNNGSADSFSVMTAQESITSATDQQEEFMHEDEGKSQNNVSVGNYSFEELKTDLMNHLVLPRGWSYTLQEASVTFVYIHQLKLVIHIFCIISQNMNVQISTFDRRVTLHLDIKFRSTADVMKYLNGLAKCKYCEGTGIGNSYSEDCRGFIMQGEEYGKSRGYQRCNPCRQFRTTLRRRQDSGKVEVRLENKQREVKALRCTNTRLRMKTKKQSDEIDKMRIDCANIQENAINDAISTLPIEQQEVVRCCLAAAKVHGPTGNRYSLEYVYEILLLRIKSRKAYEHIRNHKLLPVPSFSTLNRYLANMDSAYGFNKTTFQCLRNKSTEMTEADRRGVLLIDEMKLTAGISFDKKEMKFNGFTDLGIHTPKSQELSLGDHALVMMFQPFRGQWVQAIACFLSKGCASGTILHKLVLECVSLLENSGFRVDAVTTDGAQWNRGMWKHFGIAENKVSCMHPFDDTRQLWFNSDYSHLLKNFRNFIVSQFEIWTPDGVVKLKHWKALLKIENCDSLGLKVAFKLSKHHINPEGYAKMSVPLASELFSPEVAVAMSVYQDSHEDLEDCGPTIAFIKRINQLNTAMTSRTPAKALYINSEHYKTLQEFIEYLEAWEKEAKSKAYKFIPPNTLTGLKVTLRSTLEIVNFLVHKCYYSYLMTARLTQDALERFFGMMRNCCGSNEHPDPKLFAQVYRLVSVYSLVKPPKGSNIQGIDVFKTLLTVTENEKSTKRKREWNKSLDAICDGKNLVGTETLSVRALESDHDYNVSNSPAYAQSYYAGFIANQMRRFTKCHECLATLCSDTPKERDEVIEELTKGYLKYPSDTLFDLTKLLEETFLREVGLHSLHSDTLFRVIEKVAALEHMPIVGCEEHGKILTSRVVDYYLVARAHSSAKRYNKIHDEKRLKTKKQRKFAKLV